MSERLPVPRIVVRDEEALERRALELASGEAQDAATAGLLRLVTFRLRGRACALETSSVERAIVLSAPFAVPIADGTERPVAFVEERPMPIADLAGAAAGAPRPARGLAGSPAVVVETAAGPVAVAVDGPLELAEDRLVGAVGREGPSGAELRLAGVLSGGAALVDAPWLVAWAGRSAGS